MKKPKTYNGDLAHLPSALEPLTETKNWVAWAWELKQSKDGPKWTKPPRMATDPSRHASVSDPKTWGSYKQALKAVGARKADGIGIMLRNIDLGAADADDCRDSSSTVIKPWAEKLIEEASGCYCEVTPSGSGLRLLGVAKGPELHRRFSFDRKSHEGIELYRKTNRFITVTGLEQGSCSALPPIDDFLDKLFERYSGKTGKPADSKTSTRKLDIDDLIKNGAKEDDDHSVLFHRVVWHLASKGMSVDEITDALGKHPNGIGAKYVGRLREEVERSFGKWQSNQIVVAPGKLPSIVDAAEKALLASDWKVYQRGLLVRPAIVPLKASDDRDTMGWRLLPVSDAYLVDVMTRSANFMRYDRRSECLVPIDAPARVAKTYQARAGEWKAPVLTGIVCTPFLRIDGSVCQTEGYDAASGLLLRMGGVKFPPIPEHPSKDDALQALAKFRHPIRKFPFVKKADRSVALSAVLTALTRATLETAPLHGFDAPSAGTGKGKLVDLASMIATGFEAHAITQGRTEEELEKRLGSELLTGSGLISIDNCAHPLESAFLCMLLTQQRVKVRILGESSQPEVPNNMMVFATGNGLRFVGDLTRRALRCSIDAGVERPELRAFPFDPVALVRRRRAELVVAGLTVLRAYWVSGERVKVTPFGSFEDWSQRVREALVWLSCADPCETVENVRQDDPARLGLVAVVEQWKKHLKLDRGYKVQEVIDYAGAKGGTVEGDVGTARRERADFRVALLNVAGADGMVSNKRLGGWLARNKGKIVGGVRIEEAGISAGYSLWQLAKA
jgi:hypothetical protein